MMNTALVDPDLATTQYDALAARDWNFARSRTSEGRHAIHPYPAKFIPQIPATLIDALYPGDGSLVLDPFCGSGTTLVEAARRGIPSRGIDLHPLACLIASVKTSQPPAPDFAFIADSVVAKARVGKAPIPEIPRLDHWFEHGVQQALANLISEINAVESSTARDALRVAFSSIVVRVSRQDSDTRYAAVDKNVLPQSVYSEFLKASLRIHRALSEEWPAERPGSPTGVICQDVLKVAPERIGGKVSLVVTSPPYPNAYEYWLYHKYRMYWLGMDPVAVRTDEIGARPHYFKTNPHGVDEFERQMTTVFHLLSQVMVSGGHACLLVGDSKIHGQIVDNASLVRRAAEQLGFVQAATMRRDIPRTRSAFNPVNGRIREEQIVVLRFEP